MTDAAGYSSATPPALAFAAVPADSRLRCLEVCRDWYNALTSSNDQWLHANLSSTSGITTHVSDKFLKAVCARAGGQLVALDISHDRASITNHPAKAKDEASSVTLRGLLAVLRANKGSLRFLRIGILWLKYSEDPIVGFPPAFSHYQVNVDDLRTIQTAVPNVVLEAGLDCLVSDTAWEVQCDDDEGTMSPVPETYSKLMSILRLEPPFAALKLHSIALSYFDLRGAMEVDCRSEDLRAGYDAAEVAQETKLIGIFTALSAHTSMEGISIYCNGELALKNDTRAGAFVDMCTSLPQLRRLRLIDSGLESTTRPLLMLARLLTACPQLSTLDLWLKALDDGADIFSGRDLPAFCEALSGCSLTEFKVVPGESYRRLSEETLFADKVGGEAVIAAAQANMTLKKLTINHNDIFKSG